MTQNTKQKILTLLSKLGDRDTYSLAATELESIARSVEQTTNLHTFLTNILATDTADKPAVRRQCIHLISVLSDSLPPDSMSPYIPKIIARLTRRLRDRDSSIRSACVTAVASLSSRTSKPAFSSAFLKPLGDALFTEQEVNAQIGAALCLAAAIDATADPDPERLGRMLLPKVEKLMKCDAFKAKAAGLVVIGSVIGAGGVSGKVADGGNLKTLVGSLTAFLSSEDWAARKAAAEALEKLAVIEKDSLTEFKAGCLKVLESRKFDKVKAVREVLSQTMEAWTQIPDASLDVSPPPPRSHSSSREDASDGRNARGSKFSTPPTQMKKTTLGNRSAPPGSSLATTARKNGPSRSSDKKTGAMAARKLNYRKPLDLNVETAVHENLGMKNKETITFSEEIKQDLDDQNIQKYGVSKLSSSLVSSKEENSQHGNVVDNANEYHNTNYKDREDLSLIRSQLVEIEKQQSSLLDVLQRFVGSSQNGMQTLEARIHGLELAFDDISYDLAISTGRMSTNSRRSSCCLLPGADFFSSKFWMKTGGRNSTSRPSTSTETPLVSATRYIADRNGNSELIKLQKRRPRLHDGSGLIVNPLAEIHSEYST